MPSPSVKELLPLGDRILIEVGSIENCQGGLLCCRLDISGLYVHVPTTPVHPHFRSQTRRSRQQAAC